MHLASVQRDSYSTVQLEPIAVVIVTRVNLEYVKLPHRKPASKVRIVKLHCLYMHVCVKSEMCCYSYSYSLAV